MPWFRIGFGWSCTMDKVRGGAAAAVLFLCVLVCLSSTFGDDEEQSEKASFWEWQRLRSAYSLYSALFSTTGQYWHKVKALVNQAYARFFPPNLERGGEAEDVSVTDGRAGEKVKEALAKSLGKSKANMEDTAKSAANIAGETVHKAKEKVKRSLSEEREREHHNEL